MQTRKDLFYPVVLAALALLPVSAGAEWLLLSDHSQLGYTTTKVFPGAASSAAENNRFARLEGTVADDGAAEVRVLLDSVNTNIAIRDERMRKLVFETERFPVAVAASQVPATALNEPGLHQLDLNLRVDLHGAVKTITVPVSVMNGGDRIVVNSMSPALVQAEDFGLAAGVLELTKIAGLMYIPTTVPVTFSLVFEKK